MWACLGIAAVSLWAAQPAITVYGVMELVRTDLIRKKSDSQIAKDLRKINLAERLDQPAIDDLESAGAGRLALAELRTLHDRSSDLAPPPGKAPSASAAPSMELQNRVVEAARAIALNYTQSLPDFICTETVRRFTDTQGYWKTKDVLSLRVSYFERKEDYQLLAMNGRRAYGPYDSLTGAITQGEFGSLLHEVFAPKSQTEFHWDHLMRLRGRPAEVYTFRVRVANSHYTIAYGSGWGPRREAVAGQHGFVYVDRDTSMVVRVASEADSLPADFDVRQSSTTVDYDFTDVGGKEYLLPLEADVRMTTRQLRTKNEVEFHSYQKFGAQTSITYGEPPVAKKGQ